MKTQKGKILAQIGALILVFVVSATGLAAEQDIQTLLDNLQSKDLHTRIAAFREIEDLSGFGNSLGTPTADYCQIKPKYKTDVRIKKALFKLADLENKPKNLKLMSMEQREGYANYKYEVFATIGNMRELEGVPYLLSYGAPDIVAKVADVGEAVLPQILDKLYKGKEGLDEYKATVVLVALLEKEPRLKKYALKSKQEIKKALIYVTNKSSDTSVVGNAVYGFKELAVQGDTETLKMVEKLSEDNRTYILTGIPGGNKTTYPVREEARKVLGELKAKGICKQKTLQPSATQGVNVP